MDAKQLKPYKVDSNELVRILDQKKLPFSVEFIDCNTAADVAKSIVSMNIRGAPAIGCVAARGMCLSVSNSLKKGLATQHEYSSRFKIDYELLLNTRPTAVNLQKSLNLFRKFFAENTGLRLSEILIQFKNIAKDQELFEENSCLKMSQSAIEHIKQNIPKEKYNIMTICNTGSLATFGIGTAFGIIHSLHSQSKVSEVYALETRPYLQGLRLTSFELKNANIPHHIICDSAAGSFMKNNQIDFIVVGADRISRNGDTANKIGTYSLSVLAKYHRIPFFVAAPSSTLDPDSESAKDIEIEERNTNEITDVLEIWSDVKTTGSSIPVKNPSFDVTPYENIERIFTEKGCFFPS